MNTKASAERYGRQVLELVRAPGNDACADCGARAPRWASWSLGVFICVQCAGVHRKMGTHISKVKSLTLDTWTREQVERMRAVGNVASNAKWNPDPKRHRPPTNMEEGERHSELERFIVAKYRGQFAERLPPPVPSKDAGFVGRLSPSSSSIGTAPAAGSSFARAPSASAIESIARSRTAPIPSGSGARSSSQATAPPLPTRNQSLAVPGSSSAAATAPPARSSSALAMAVPPARSSSSMQFATPASAVSASGPPPVSYAARSSVFDDLLSLQSQSPLPPAGAGMTHAAGNPWSGMSMQVQMQQQQQQQQMQQMQQQQQQQAQMQQMQMQQTGMGGMASPVGLGQHAFFAQQAPQQQAQMLGASAFGSLSPTSPYAPQSNSPFFAPQQQGMMSPGHMLGQQAFGNAQQDYNFPQQANGISHANGTSSPFAQTPGTGYTAGFGQQQQAQGQQQQPQFGAFANAMMPGTGQQQQQQPQQQQWGQQQAYGGGGGLWG